MEDASTPRVVPPRTVSDCCGCLCADPGWSCSSDTCTVDGVLEDLWSEAGFFEIEPGVLFRGDATLRARMWYSFWPADTDPEKKPLLVIFQGGPYASVAILWGGNTGPFTLDPARTGGEAIAPNPHSWTRFANLLYVDSPFAGFSYFVGAHDAAESAAAEAAAFVRVLLRFLSRHPLLERAPVVLVGESYGGARATLMLRQLLGYAELEAEDAWHHDPELASEILRHLRRTHAAEQRSDFAPSEIAEQFRGQVMVQGVAVSDFRPTWSSFRPEEERVPSPAQEELASTLEADIVARLPALMSAAVDPDVLATLTGVDVESIAWLHASERIDATRNGHTDSQPVDTSKLSARFGTLTANDAYFIARTGVCKPGCAEGWLEQGTDAAFANNLRHVGVFMTDARGDPALDSLRVLEVLPQVSDVATAQLTLDPVRGRSITFAFEDGLTRGVLIPPYESSGHPVALYEPEKLADDLRAWLAELVK